MAEGSYMSGVVNPRPFHESIVAVIMSPSVSIAALVAYGDVIKATKIVANHDAIIAAWSEGATAAIIGKWWSIDNSGVVEYVTEQKQLVEAGVKEETVNTMFGELVVGNEYRDRNGIHCMAILSGERLMELPLEGYKKGRATDMGAATEVRKIILKAA